MPDSIRESLRAELEETRAAYHHLLAEIHDGTWDRATANDAWNVRQTMWHMTLAPDMLPQDVKMIRSGRMFTPPAWLFNKINIYYTRFGARNATAESLGRRYDKAHNKVIGLLDDIGQEEWQKSGRYPDINENLSAGERTLEEMFRYLAVHFREHEKDVRKAMIEE